ncbi:MAG TPA: hypothetical protein VG965_01260 [Patescibacteria group bacterium]|nr:hypothetical protein [Patescibacteria group bacterium]
MSEQSRIGGIFLWLKIVRVPLNRTSTLLTGTLGASIRSEHVYAFKHFDYMNEIDYQQREKDFHALTPRARWERGYAAMGPDVAWRETSMNMNLSDGSAESMKVLNTQIGGIFSYFYNEKTWQKRLVKDVDFDVVTEETGIPLPRIRSVVELMLKHDIVKTETHKRVNEFVKEIDEIDLLPPHPLTALRQAHRIATDAQNSLRTPEWGS